MEEELCSRNHRHGCCESTEPQVPASPEALLATADVVVRGLSGGRRRRCRVILGEGRGFTTDLVDVFVPWPLPVEAAGRGLAAALALQASPTKDLVAGIGITGLTRRQRAALRLVEGAAALDWAGRRWPGLAAALEAGSGGVAPTDAEGLTAADLLGRAMRLAASAGRRAVEVPPLFGQLPLLASDRPSLRGVRMQAESRLPWSSERRVRRLTTGSIALGGGGDGDARRAGPPDLAEEQRQAGRRRSRLGIPYPEWNVATAGYRPDHVTVMEHHVRAAGAHRRPVDPRLAAWFEQPLERQWHHRREDGSDLDVDAVTDALADGLAGAGHSPRLYRERLARHRDVACALLLDRSGSLAQRDHLTHELACADALVAAMARAGERPGVFAFWSDTRHQVVVDVVCGFDDRRPVLPGSAGLSPRGCTRTGAALRHVTARLAAVPARRRMVLALGDGLPSDDGYEGEYAWADVVKAVEEAERAGIVVAFVGVGSPSQDPLAALLPRQFHRVHRIGDLAPVLAAVHAQLVA